MIVVYTADRSTGGLFVQDVTKNPDGTFTTGPPRPLGEVVAERERLAERAQAAAEPTEKGV